MIYDVFLVVHEYPNAFLEILRAFSTLEKAENFIIDTFPHFYYLKEEDAYIFEDYDKENLEDEERYYILTLPLTE
jgi:hypothetical protein